MQIIIFVTINTTIKIVILQKESESRHPYSSNKFLIDSHGSGNKSGSFFSITSVGIAITRRFLLNT